MEPESQHQYRELKKLSSLLDTYFEGPFGVRFGLDALIGLIPVIGDVISTAFSFYIILRAYFLGCGPSTLIRMALNVLFENLVDMLPFIGNIFDFFWRSNQRNLILLEQHLENPRRVTLTSRLILLGIFLSLLVGIVMSAWFSWWVLMSILEFMSLATS
jgi:hypothetical protein